MMKLHLIYLTICSLSQALYINRNMIMNRLPQHRPMSFRPGVTLQRPWHPRLVSAASHRAPYVIYRAPQPQHRYAVKHFNPVTRNMFPGLGAPGGQWKTTARLPPSPAVTEQEFIRAASAHANGGTGAIHTIPAPNLSLSEKPIVVVDSENFVSNSATSEAPKVKYEVTEKYPDRAAVIQLPKIEQPIGFSKATSLTTPELQALVRNGAALQIAAELGLSAIGYPQHQEPVRHHHQPIVQQAVVPQQTFLSQQPMLPQQFTIQGLNGLATQDVMHAGPDGIVISPNALYQPDPAFMNKLANQLLQRFPGIEFVPYVAESQHQPVHVPPQTPPQQVRVSPQTPPQQIHVPPQMPPQQVHVPPQTPLQHLFLLENEQITKQTPSAFVPNEIQNQKNVVQRETQEGTVVTLVPQELIGNVTENQIEVTSASQPKNITIELVAAESQPATSTINLILETSTEAQRVTPIYYAQIGQSVGNVEASGFYSAINDVRAAAALAQVEKPQESTKVQDNITTSTMNPMLKDYFIQKTETDANNQTVAEIKPLLGVPFTKATDSVKVAYTLLRTDDKEAKVAKDGSVYAGQIVEATVSEDHDFNKEKVTLLSRRAPIRLFAVTEKKETQSTTLTPQKMTVVKAKIPPKSKLTFDDKTGEPVLRIYASYVDSPMQKELLTSKLATTKHVKEVSRKQDAAEDSWKSSTVTNMDKTQGFDGNQVTQFGLKLRSRSDDYLPLFEDYED